MWLQVVAARDQKWRVASDKSDLLSLLRQFRTKIGGGLSQGISKKNWDPLRILATGEAGNFKFGTQLGFWTSFARNNV